ncbi:MAG: hypothetical protein HY887_05760 [Deltaproteobacteria bacterium]|nr:hypothetical protein [Deltaproteobacteria bacterium]
MEERDITRQRLMSRAPEHGDTLKFILGFACPGSAGEKTEGIIKRFKGLRGLADASTGELCSVPGVRAGAAVLIRLIKDASRAYLKERVIGRRAATSFDGLLDYLTMELSGERVEKFLAVYLSGADEVLSVEVLHEGTISQTVVYPRKAIEGAFRTGAKGFIFAHNHPSGDPAPSAVDKELAVQLDKAAASAGLKVFDHLIVGRHAHYSLRQAGFISASR